VFGAEDEMDVKSRKGLRHKGGYWRGGWLF
jgi:hypothetical protein